MRLRPALAVLALPLILSCSTAQVRSVGQSQLREYVIVLDSAAIPAERHAAKEFQRYVEKSTGVRLPIVAEPKAGQTIFIGTGSQLARFAPDLASEELANEEFILEPRAGNLIVLGGRTRGTLYGVYGYLEDFVGCRWFTHDVEKVPQRKTLPMPSARIRERPALEYREPFFREAANKLWAARNRVNGINFDLDDSVGDKIRMTGFVHTFNELVPPEKYFEEHPEYYSLVRGGRTAEYAQLCLTNPDVVRVTIESVFRWIEENPKSTIFSVSQNDWEGYCECESCAALDAREGTQAGTLITFCNKIAEAVSAQHPDKYIDTLAYRYTQEPPKYVRPHPNLIVRLCHMEPSCDSHPLATCPKNADYIEDLRAWSEITEKVYIWHYVTNFSHYLMPFPNFNAIREDIRFYDEAGVDGLFCQGNFSSKGGGEMAELRSYVLAQLLWDPTRDTDALVDEFLRGVYGPAWRPIREYFDLLHARVREENIHIDLYSPPESGHLPPKLRRKSQALFQEALDLAKSSIFAARVEEVRSWMDYADIYFQRRQFEQTGTGEIDAQLVERFIRTTQTNNVSHINEWNPIEPYYESLRSNGPFVTDWWLLGPLTQDAAKPVTPVGKIVLNGRFEGLNAKATEWRKITGPAAYLDMTERLSPHDIVGSAYAFTYLISETERETVLSMGSNDGCEVWLNGESVFRDMSPHKASPDQVRIPVRLRAGVNELLCKVYQLGGGWGLYMRLPADAETVRPALGKN